MKETLRLVRLKFDLPVLFCRNSVHLKLPTGLLLSRQDMENSRILFSDIKGKKNKTQKQHKE